MSRSGLWLSAAINCSVAVATPAAGAETVHLLLETRADAGAGSELFLADFASLGSFLASGSGGEGGSFIGTNIAGDYKVAGFDIYQDKPYLLLQTRVDAGAGSELFLADFASLDSFLASGSGGEGGSFIGINIAGDYEVAGFDIQPVATPVPEPTTWAVMILGFGGVGSALRRSRRKALRTGGRFADL